MKTNTGPHDNALVQRHSRELEFAAYDNLHPELRKIIQHLPCNFSALEVFGLMLEQGNTKAAKIINEIIQQQFPGYRPI